MMYMYLCIASGLRFRYSAHAMLVLYYSSQNLKMTALHYASEGGHHDTVGMLLERGADLNTCDWVSGVYGMIEAECVHGL